MQRVGALVYGLSAKLMNPHAPSWWRHCWSLFSGSAVSYVGDVERKGEGGGEERNGYCIIPGTAGPWPVILPKAGQGKKNSKMILDTDMCIIFDHIKHTSSITCMQYVQHKYNIIMEYWLHFSGWHFKLIFSTFLSHATDNILVVNLHNTCILHAIHNKLNTCIE